MSKKPNKISIGKRIHVEPDSVYEGKVVSLGNKAVINFFKRFIGDRAVIIMSDKIKNKEYQKKKQEQEEEEIADLWYKYTY